VCDGEAALTKSMNQWTSNPLDKQFDIIHTIRAGIRQTKVIWKSKHIKGHQDQVALLLCDKARWNNEMDQVAKNIGNTYKQAQTHRSMANHGNYGWTTKKGAQQ